MGMDLCLLAYGTSLDVVFDPLLHPDPPVVSLHFLECFVSSWVSSCRSIVCIAHYCSFHFSYIWNDDLSFWGVEDADLLG